MSASSGSSSARSYARLGAGLVLVLLALAATGCAVEDPRQRAVRAEVQRHVSGMAQYDSEETHCTGSPRPWFVEREAAVFICAVRLASGGCDWFRATVVRLSVDVTLEARDAGCVLPL